MSRKLVVAFGLSLLMTVTVTAPTWAVPTNWNGGVGNYTDGTQWDTASAPTSADTATVNSGTATFTTGPLLTIQAPGGSNGASLTIGGTGTVISTAGGIRLGDGGGTSGTLTMTGNSTLTVGAVGNQWSAIGHSGNGTFNISGSAVANFQGAGLGSNVSSFSSALNSGSVGIINQSGSSTINSQTGVTLSRNAGTTATYTMNGGTLNAVTSGTPTGGRHSLSIGIGGNATFIQNSGNVNVFNNTGNSPGLVVADQGSSVGTYNQSGGSLVAGTTGVSTWSGIGHSGDGQFNLSGNATAEFRGIGLAGNVASLSSGIGNGSNSSINQSGTSTLVSESGLTLGRDVGSIGALNVSGGTANLATVAPSGGLNGIDIGRAGSGLVTVSGTGIVNVQTGNAALASNGGTGTLNVNGGQFNVINGNITEAGASTININGGTLSVQGGTAGSIAVDVFNVGTAGVGSHSMGGTQSLNVGVDVNIRNNGQFTQSGGSVSAGRWVITGQGGAGDHYNISAGTVTAGDAVILGNGAGNSQFTQSGGTVTSNVWMGVGQSAGTSTYNLSGGFVNSGAGSGSNRGLEVGRDGVGLFNNSGGTVTIAGETWVAVNGGANGSTYTLTGNGVHNTGGIRIGGSGNGTFTQNGAATQLNTSQLFVLGQNTGSVGTYNLSSGTLNANGAGNSVWVGVNGTGNFNQSGGVANVAQDMTIAGNAGATGTVNLSGGNLNIGGNITENGNSTININGGTLSVQGGTAGSIAVDAFNVGTTGTGSHAMGGTQSLNIGVDLNIRNGGQFTQTGGSVSAGRWIISGQGTGGDHFNISAGTATAGDAVILGNGAGNSQFTQTGGTVNSNVWMGIGQSAGTSTYNLSAGSLNSGPGSGSGRGLEVGRDGVGLLNQSGGTVTIAGETVVALNGGATGSTVTLTGTGIFNTAGIRIGENGNGTVTQNGAATQLNSSRLFVLGQNGGTGTYNLTSGTLNANTSGIDGTGAWIGVNGVGDFNQTGGTFNVTNEMYVAGQPGSSGDYTISGGSLNLLNSQMRLGNSGTGVFNQDGGSVDVAGFIAMGQNAGSNGTYNMTNGTLDVNTAGAGGSVGLWVGVNSVADFNQSGGSANVTGDILIGGNAPSTGTVDLSGGGLSSTTHTVVGNSGMGTLNVSGTGTLTTPDLTIGLNPGSTGILNQTGGVINVTNPSTHTVADGGAGTVNHSGGVTNVVGNMNIGTSTGMGVYTLSGTGELDFLDTSGPSPTFFPAAPATQVTTGLDPSTLTVGLNGTFNFDGGTLRNVTTIDVTSATGMSFDQDGGRFVIGVDGVDPNNPDTTRAITTIVGGDYDQNAGTLVVDIFGPNAAGGSGEAASNGGGLDPLDPNMDSDLLHVRGSADLDGILEVNLNGFTPGPFHWYDVLLADGTIDDSGLTVDGVHLFRVIDNPFGDGQILQVAVPEPASLMIWSLIGLGLAGFGYYRIRRKK